NRERLGTGAAAFAAACDAIRGWKMFAAPLGWGEAAGRATANRGDGALVAHAVGLWWLNALRIVYVTDEPRRFGFAYGTLPGHVEQGEERFLVELTEDDAVWYDIVAFSRPRHLLTKIGYPLVRQMQKRFGRESATALVRAVSE